jgi:hypothetical protein
MEEGKVRQGLFFPGGSHWYLCYNENKGVLRPCQTKELAPTLVEVRFGKNGDPIKVGLNGKGYEGISYTGPFDTLRVALSFRKWLGHKKPEATQ